MTTLLWFSKPSEKYLLFTLIIVASANFFYELSLIFYNSILKRISEPSNLGKSSGFSFALGYIGGILILIICIKIFIDNDVLPFFGLPILSTDDLTGAFSNPAPLTIACMFVMSAGLEKSGCIRSLGAGFKKLAGQTEIRTLVTIMVVGAVLSAFVNNTPVVVVFLPIVLSLARSSELKSSRLLMPLSFACILGGTCTLTGSSTNLIIDGIAQKQYIILTQKI